MTLEAVDKRIQRWSFVYYTSITSV